MGLEPSVTTVSDLNELWPLGTDERANGDDHIRNLKKALKAHEADADIHAGAKSNNNPLNHDRYTDAEAVAAMGVKGNTNPLNHDRHTDAQIIAAVPIMGASGTNHAPGRTPDTPAISGSTKFLREDASWAVPSASGGTFVARDATERDYFRTGTWDTPVEIDLSSIVPSGAKAVLLHAKIVSTVTNTAVYFRKKGSTADFESSPAATVHYSGWQAYDIVLPLGSDRIIEGCAGIQSGKTLNVYLTVAGWWT